jgi:hypothetical protein
VPLFSQPTTGASHASPFAACGLLCVLQLAASLAKLHAQGLVVTGLGAGTVAVAAVVGRYEHVPTGSVHQD